MWQVLIVFLRYGVLPALGINRVKAEDGTPAGGPVRMRLALDELGGAWVKLGQMLAMRFDLLPAAYCEELFKLLNAVPPFPYAQVREIVRAGARRPAGRGVRVLRDRARLLRRRSARCIAPRSLAASTVAVKVQRPGIREIMRADIDLMYASRGCSTSSRFFGATRSRGGHRRVRALDRGRAGLPASRRARRSMLTSTRKAKMERFARVYRGYTTSRVLTTEMIEGIPLIEIMPRRRAANAAYLDVLEEHGYDLERIARHLDWNMLNQVYVFGCFHADLHPANLFVLPGDAIGYVDFGIVGQLPEEVRESLTRYSWLLFRGNIDAAIVELMRWLSPTSPSWRD